MYYLTALIFTFMVALAPRFAFATLGENEATVEADKLSLTGVHKVKTLTSFSVHEITTSNGISVKEYVSSNGDIFGITWRGPVHPDLEVLLGKYHDEYRRHFDNKPKRYGHGHETLKTPNIVVESGGHMRDVRGKAYIPLLIPKGMTEADIE